MEVVPNQMVDASSMLGLLGSAIEEADEESEKNRREEGLLDEIEKMVKQGKGWSDEKRRDYLDKLHEGPELPLFSDSVDEMDPRLVEALAELKYDGEEPEQMAEAAKYDGNKDYMTAVKLKRKMYYRQALNHYTEGCLHALKAQQKVGTEKQLSEEKAAELNALFSTLLSNRAACHLVLKNFGSAKRDCGDSVRMVPNNTKAYFRKAKACLELRQYEEGLVSIASALELATEGGSVGGSATEVETLKAKLEAGLAERKRREALAAAAEAKEMAELRELYDNITLRAGAKVGPGIAADGYQQQTSDKLPGIDEEGGGGGAAAETPELEWPCYFLYPQYSQSDFIESFSESTMLAEHMATIFSEDGPPAVWDEKWEYKCSSMECYLQLNAMPAFKSSDEWVHWVRLKKAARGELSSFMAPEDARKKLKGLEKGSTVHADDQTWLRLPPAATLAQLLRYPSHVVPGAVLTLHFYPRESEAHALFLKKTSKRIADFDLATIPPKPYIPRGPVAPPPPP
mmetsp:Transcript_42625/g.86176  ORF Transcript_42625/g.86176 Transcript_42625/m.86176 type:complete len:514 (+) Transcript_42625:109-1650(+)